MLASPLTLCCILLVCTFVNVQWSRISGRFVTIFIFGIRCKRQIIRLFGILENLGFYPSIVCTCKIGEIMKLIFFGNVYVFFQKTIADYHPKYIQVTIKLLLMKAPGRQELLKLLARGAKGWASPREILTEILVNAHPIQQRLCQLIKDTEWCSSFSTAASKHSCAQKALRECWRKCEMENKLQCFDCLNNYGGLMTHVYNPFSKKLSCLPTNILNHKTLNYWPEFLEVNSVSFKQLCRSWTWLQSVEIFLIRKRTGSVSVSVCFFVQMFARSSWNNY